MGTGPADPDDLLGELMALPPQGRCALIDGHPPVDQTLARLGQAVEQRVIDDLDRALDEAAALVELADARGGPAARAGARRALAHGLAYANRYGEAMEILDESVALAERAGDRLAEARARLAMVHALARLGRTAEAIDAGRAALDGFRELRADDWAAKAEVNLGVVQRMAGDPAEALAHFDRARAALASNAVNLAQLDSNRADALLELNRFQDAEIAFRSALETFNRAGMAQAAAIAEGNLADLLCMQGRLDAALFHFEQARRRFETAGAAGDLARLEAEQAEAFAAAGLHDQAADGFAHALPQLDQRGLAREAARAALALGRALSRLGRHDEARRALDDAHGRFEALDTSAGLARVDIARGELAMADGDLAIATRHLTDALERLEARPVEAAVVRHRLATIALAAGDAAAALRHVEVALAAAWDLAPLRADLLHARARARLAGGDRDGALDDLAASVAGIERLRGSLGAERLRAAFAAQRMGAYEDLVSALLGSDRPQRLADAFAVVEQARARALLDLVAGAVRHEADGAGNGRVAGSPQLAEVLALRAELSALYSRFPQPAEGAEEAVRSWHRQLDSCERRLAAAESRLGSATGLGGLFAAPSDLAAVQARLEPGTTLVEYYLAGDELVALVVAPESIHAARRLATRGEVDDAVERAQFQIERAASYHAPEAATAAALVADAKRELAGLHAMLVAPIAGAIEGARRLVVVPHGPLHAVPFCALYDGDRYLIETREITCAPSASVLAHLRAPADRPSRSLVFGIWDEQAPRIEQEVATVSSLLPGAVSYTGPEATWQRLRDECGRADVVHLACHGWFCPQSPLAAGVRLADRWMTVRDVYSLNLSGATVVLSGCSTGRAALTRGDDILGLTRGFLAAGASALVTSLWAVHDESAEKLVASIYRLWHNGRAGGDLALPGALREAQRTLMRTRPHPAHWAPFVLVGRP